MLQRFNTHFRALHADTPEMVRTAKMIRYQVYCLERNFEKPGEHAGCMESDMYDTTAVHSLVVHRASSEAIGTARLILPEQGLPIQRILQEQGLRVEDHFPVATAAEVSRFAISNRLRRRPGETRAPDSGRQEDSCGILPFLGLLQNLLRQSIALGVTHWTAIMEPKLLRMQAAMGVHSTPVGPMVFYHGMRQPSFCSLSGMLERLRRERPENWMVVTDGGALIPACATPNVQAGRLAA